ncbi:hypothetical protein FNF27_02150 [Cafeteria roenbergensis]|uniref:NAA35-like N-terminal domain-containing protein n=2 Tax=Cafeteria roenbergensis TaxID=33653 RepID=A0A5A8EGR4_CAFRO|nr:hypothetical protein FNF27_02150 [Cafeteria roenbergensis]
MAAPDHGSGDAAPEWRDVTELASAARAELGVGDLLFAKGFAFGEAMNVVELMHPRMDPGMRVRRQADDLIRERVETGALRLHLPIADLVRVWDALFQQTFSFLDANSMAETVFSCLYLHRPALAALRERACLPAVCSVGRSDQVVDVMPTTPDPSRALYEKKWAAMQAASGAESGGLDLGITGSKISLSAAQQQVHQPCEQAGAVANGDTLSPPCAVPAGVTPAAPGSAEHVSAVVLAALATGFACLVGRTRTSLIFADLYEDEDLCASTFGLDAADDVSDAHVLALLADAESLLAHASGAAAPDCAPLATLEAALAKDAATWGGFMDPLFHSAAGKGALARADAAASGAGGPEAGSGGAWLPRPEATAWGLGGPLPLAAVVGAPVPATASMPRLTALWRAGGASALRALCSPWTMPSPEAAAGLAGASPPTEPAPAAALAAGAAAEAAIDRTMPTLLERAAVPLTDEALAWCAHDGPGVAADLMTRLRWLRARLGADLAFRRAVEASPAAGCNLPGTGPQVSPDPATMEDDVALAHSVLLHGAAAAHGISADCLRSLEGRFTPVPREAADAAPAGEAGDADDASTASAAATAATAAAAGGDGVGGSDASAGSGTGAALGRMQVRGSTATKGLVPTPPGVMDASVLDSALAAAQPRFLPGGTLEEAVERALCQSRGLAAVCCARVFATSDPAVSTAELARLMTMPRFDSKAPQSTQRMANHATELAIAHIAAGADRFSPAVHATAAVRDPLGLRRISLFGLWDLVDVLRVAGPSTFDSVVRSRLYMLVAPRNRDQRIFGVRDPRRVVEAALLDRGLGLDEVTAAPTARVVTRSATRLVQLVRVLCMSDARMHRMLDVAISDWAVVQAESWAVDSIPRASPVLATPASQADLTGSTSPLGRAVVPSLAAAVRAAAKAGTGAPARLAALASGAAAEAAADDADAAGSAKATPTSEDRPMMVHLSMTALLRLQMASMDLSLRLQLVHDDDMPALVWYQDYIATMTSLYHSCGGKALVRGWRASQREGGSSKPGKGKPGKGKPGKGKPGKGKPGKGKAAKGKAARDDGGAAGPLGATEEQSLADVSLPPLMSDTLQSVRRDVSRVSFMLAAAMTQVGALPEQPPAEDEVAHFRFEERFAQVLRSHDPEPLSWHSFRSNFGPDRVQVSGSVSSSKRTLEACFGALQRVIRHSRDQAARGVGSEAVHPPEHVEAIRKQAIDAPPAVKAALVSALSRPPLLCRSAAGDLLPGAVEAGLVPAVLADWLELQVSAQLRPLTASALAAIKATSDILELHKRVTADGDEAAPAPKGSLGTTAHPYVPVPIVC